MPKRTPPQPEGALYVRLPANAVDKLHRAAEALGVHKKDLIAGLVSKYVDPDSRRGLSALGALSEPRRIMVDLGEPGPTLGAYSFQPYDPPEVMNAEQAGQLLQLDEKIVLELAESGQLPGRKLGNQWRFSRAAVIAWLSGESGGGREPHYPGERPSDRSSDRSRR
ncbi:MAG: helix-turn-helix domain-containing protein [bacterium]